jgi:hypothetical protein
LKQIGRELNVRSVPTKHYLIVQCGRMEGFLVLDYMSRAAEAIGALAGWVRAGKIKTCGKALTTRRRRCGGCSRAATRASNYWASPSSSLQQMGLASTTLSSEAAEAASRKLESSLAVGFN